MYQSIKARLLCGDSFLDLDQVEPATQYYEQAIALAKQMYPETWRGIVELTHWANVVGVLSAGEQYQKAVPIAAAVWGLNKKMEFPLDFPPPKNPYPNHVSSRSATWMDLTSQLETLAKGDGSPGIAESRREALTLRCYDAVTNMVSVDPKHPQRIEMENSYRVFAYGTCSYAIEANPADPEPYILRGFMYLAQARVSAGASGMWSPTRIQALQDAEADLRRGATLPERTDEMFKGSTRSLAAQLLNEVRRLRDTSQD